MTKKVRFEKCPICDSGDIVKLPNGWAGDGAIPIVACGNPWHYTEATMSDYNAGRLAEEVTA